MKCANCNETLKRNFKELFKFKDIALGIYHCKNCGKTSKVPIKYYKQAVMVVFTLGFLIPIPCMIASQYFYGHYLNGLIASIIPYFIVFQYWEKRNITLVVKRDPSKKRKEAKLAKS